MPTKKQKPKPRPKSKPSYMQILRDEFRYCKTDVVYFANNYCVIEDKDSPEIVIPFKGWDAQNKVLKEISENRLNLILKARQLGMTWLSLYVCIHDILFNTGHTVVALSKTEEDAKELVRRATVILENLTTMLAVGRRTFKATASTISIFNDKGAPSFFKAFPASPSAGRSFTGNILMLDEWAFQEFAEEIWTSAYPTINRPTGGKVIGVSTIKKGTLFEKLWCDKNAFHKIFLSVFEDPRRTEEWYDQTQIDLGVKIKQEYPRTAEEALANIGGAFFPEFDYNIHTCSPFVIPSDWAIYSSLDYGLDMFAHYKIAIDNERNVYVFHEIYESNLIIADAAREIKNADRRVFDDGTATPWLIPRTRLAPPDMWNRSPETGKSKFIVFGENGINLVKSNNDRQTGWLTIKELLKINTLPDGTRYAKLKIFRTCHNLIRTLQQILIDEKNPNDCAKDPHELTHAPDALRYFTIYWSHPSLPAEPKRVKYRPDQLEDWRNARTPEERAMIEKAYGGKPL